MHSKKLGIMIREIFIKALLIFLCFYGVIWIFNHISSWAGIAVGVVGIYFAVELILKKCK